MVGVSVGVIVGVAVTVGVTTGPLPGIVSLIALSSGMLSMQTRGQRSEENNVWMRQP